jgi:hypothetical protein
VTSAPGLTLWRCELRCAWITEPTCLALRTREAPRDPRYPLATPRATSPCTDCPGVRALARQRGAPKPRRLAT